MIKTDREVVKTSLLCALLIRVGVLLRKPFLILHTSYVLWKSFGIEHLPFSPPSHHIQGARPRYPRHGRSRDLSNRGERCSVSPTGLCPLLSGVNLAMTALVFSRGLGQLPRPFPAHSCPPYGGPTWIRHLATPGSSLSLLFRLYLWRQKVTWQAEEEFMQQNQTPPPVGRSRGRRSKATNC